jgi:hypothetical protein
MNNELERTWKEVVMAYFKVLSQNMAGESKEKPQNLESG